MLHPLAIASGMATRTSYEALVPTLLGNDVRSHASRNVQPLTLAFTQIPTAPYIAISTPDGTQFVHRSLPNLSAESAGRDRPPTGTLISLSPSPQASSSVPIPKANTLSPRKQQTARTVGRTRPLTALGVLFPLRSSSRRSRL